MAGEKFDVEKLINEIENRPALWDMRRKEYSDRVMRRKCWEEIVDLFANIESTTDEKKKLGDELHKKWKNIRDNYSRDIQQRKGKSGAGGRHKAPYIYTRRLQFLMDIIVPRQTINSLESTESFDVESTLEFNKNVAETSTPISTKENPSRIGKKRLHSVEAKILSSLESYEKRVNKPVIEDDNRYFALSLVPSLASLPRHLNTKCRIEIMQTISKYVTMAEPQQIAHLPAYEPTFPSIHYPLESTPVLHSQQYGISSATSENALNQQTIVHPAPSPAESTASFISNFSDDSQLTIF